MVKVRGIVKVIGISAALALLGGADGCKPKKQSEAKAGPPVSVTAKQLHQDYKANEVNADEQYRDRVLVVSGKVDSIKKDLSDDPYVTLATGNQFEDVRAEFTDTKSLGSLRAGQTVTIRCVGDNVIMGSPKLADCSLE